jgi:uncharacterized membrane protein
VSGSHAVAKVKVQVLRFDSGKAPGTSALERNDTVERAIIFVASALYALVYFLLNYNRFRTYDSGGDFGLFMQSMNDESGLLRNAVEGSHYSAHFSPIFELFVPITRLGHSIIPITLAQGVAGGLVALGLYSIARRMLPSKLALAISAVGLVYPALAGVMFGDPYENIFAPAATVWLVASVVSRNWARAFILVLLALSIKEDQAVFLIWGSIVATAYANHTRDFALRRFSILSLAVSAITLLVFIAVIRPGVESTSPWYALQATFQAAPDDVSGGFGVAGRLGYLAEVLVPLLLLPCFAPRILFLGLPALAEVLLSRNSMVWTMGQHYAGVWIGYVLLAMIFGLVRIHARRPGLARSLIAGVLAICIADLAFASPTHWTRHVHVFSQHDRDLDTLLASSLPKSRTIGMPDEIYAHEWNLNGAMRGLAKSPDYAMVDRTLSSSSLEREMDEEILSGRYGAYALVWSRFSVSLYERRTRSNSSRVEK